MKQLYAVASVFLVIVAAITLGTSTWQASTVYAWNCQLPENQGVAECPFFTPASKPTTTPTVVVVNIETTKPLEARLSNSVKVCHYDTQQGWMLETKTTYRGYNELPYGQPATPFADYRPVNGICTQPEVVPVVVTPVVVTAIIVAPVSDSPMAQPTPIETPETPATLVETVVAAPETPVMGTPMDTPEMDIPEVQVPVFLPTTGDGSTAE